MIHLLLAVIYVSFISLGLPDSLLGAAWPSIYQGFGVPVSYSGVIFCIISVGTVLSSLQSDRITRRFGAGGVTAISVAMTAAALFGFSVSSSFWAMCLWAIPYGLGAGSVDAALNNYVALHFASRHMSWLHCMWGIGASVGPYIMGAALSSRAGWQTGYRVISVMQMVLTIIILLSLPLWKTKSGANAEEREAVPAEALTLKQIFRISGVKEVLVTFFCYCSLEQTTSLWASSYLVLNRGIAPETAAGFASLFFVGIAFNSQFFHSLAHAAHSFRVFFQVARSFCHQVKVHLLCTGTIEIVHQSSDVRIATVLATHIQNMSSIFKWLS